MKIPASISISPFSPAGILRVTGPDAQTFLQGQFTNDLSTISAGGAVYGLWLDRRGKVIADGTVVAAAGGEALWIVSIASPAAVIERHLGGHIIADDVALADETGAWSGISLLGSGAGGWLAAGARAGLVFPGRRETGENWEWILPRGDLAAAMGALAGVPVLGADEMERRRIASGIPSVPGDIGPGDLPNEGGLDRQAVSYSKGCYIGQEVMARIKSLGRVRRALVRVRGTTPPPPVPAGLWRGDKREGELRSAVAQAGGFAGLALVSTAAASEGGALALALGAVPTVEVVPGP